MARRNRSTEALAVVNALGEDARMNDPRVQGSQSLHAMQGEYVIAVRRNGLAQLGAGVRRVAPNAQCVMLAMDASVATPWGEQAADSLRASGLRVESISLQAIEAHKSIEEVGRIWSAMLAAKMQRTDVLVALGGGIIGDIAGFAAATFLRGIPLVMAPTTLLAMVDAAIGGKTAVNLPLPQTDDARVVPSGQDDRGQRMLGKNLAGAFHAPAWVLCDVETLTSLSDRDYRCGLAESIKHGLLCDPSLLEWISGHREKILARDLDTVSTLVQRSAAIKAAIVSRDMFERGERAHLNLGHTFAHALETLLHDQLRHGEAVAIGLVAAVAASKAAGWWQDADPVAFAKRLAELGLPTQVAQSINKAKLLEIMGFDKKSEGGRQRVVLLRGLGQPDVLVDPGAEVVAAGWSAVGVL